MSEHIILSERPEDIKKAAKWAKEQKEKQRRNNEVGERLWKKMFPIISLLGSALTMVPVEIISPSFVSRSKTIRAPTSCFESSVTPSTIFAMQFFIRVSSSTFSVVKLRKVRLEILVFPILSRAWRSSGWKTTTIAIIPKLKTCSRR